MCRRTSGASGLELVLEALWHSGVRGAVIPCGLYTHLQRGNVVCIQFEAQSSVRVVESEPLLDIVPVTYNPFDVSTLC
jgi:hypothetical protein